MPYDTDWEFPRDRLNFLKMIGSGAFGEVWLAEAEGILTLEPRDKTSNAAKRRSKIRRSQRYTHLSGREKKKKALPESAREKTLVAVKTLKGVFIQPLSRRLQPLSHHRLVFYRCFHGHCSQEIRDIIPVPLRRGRTTRSSTHSHPFQVSLPNPRTLSHKSSFIPRTCNLWNVLPSTRFPESCSLPSFESKINNFDLISLSS